MGGLHATRPTHSVVETPTSLMDLLDSLPFLPTSPPSLYLDLQGNNLSRHGSLSLLTVHIAPHHHAYIIDVSKLEHGAFTTYGPRQKTLRSILESPAIPKVFFDLRNAADALYAHYRIGLQNVQDVQLMENASRPGYVFGKRYLNSLAKCVQADTELSPTQRSAWIISQSKMSALFDSTRGGTCPLFHQRPLRKDVVEFCVQNVFLLPHFRRAYWNRLDLGWKRKVVEETRKRLLHSQSAFYDPHGEEKALGPWQATAPENVVFTSYEELIETHPCVGEKSWIDEESSSDESEDEPPPTPAKDVPPRPTWREVSMKVLPPIPRDEELDLDGSWFKEIL